MQSCVNKALRRRACLLLTVLFICSCLGFARHAWTKEETKALRLPVQVGGSPIFGNKKAPVTLIEFTDFECPFCGAAQPTLQRIFKEYPDQVRLVFKHFPLRFHRNARKAHLASLCAQEQGKFWEYRNMLFQNQRALGQDDLIQYAEQLGLAVEPFKICLNQETYNAKILEDIKEATTLGVRGTPTFLVNGRPLPGAQPFSSFQEMIEEELRPKEE